MHRVQAQQNQDNVMWEENRLLQSGVVRRTSVNEEEEKDLVRVQIIVMDIKPPFLDGRMVTARPASSLHNGTTLWFRLLFVLQIDLTLSPNDAGAHAAAGPSQPREGPHR
jgi:hypothetical protein